MAVYGYARVSTLEQDLTVQINALETAGIEVLFSEKLSGKSAKTRPQLTELLATVKEGDVIIVYKLDRLGRSISDVVRIYEELLSNGVHFVSLSEGIDTRRSNDIMTKALITMLGLFGEMERTFILERTAAGRELAKNNGVKFGRPGMSKKRIDHAIKLWTEGKDTIGEIEASTGVSKSVLYRHIKERGLTR
ncbi:recombinase family protein [Bacillus sp. AFS041924]|uniref:recombinase family protein n=1 Tax=Bacillus sp. AFS041924 TaxID=2033503 RepID=UPI0020D27712|nr:recombinase family protein [Bacillus sp. AFS041924]